MAADEVAATYTANGQTETLTDGEGNTTSYAFDGHDRPVRTCYLTASPSACTTSASDREELTYDPAGNVTNQRLRDNTDIGYTYDALNRVTTKDLPGSQLDVNFGYDLLGQLTGASTTAQTLTFTYDALGRQVSEEGPLGTVSRNYDVGGRRISLSGPTYYAAYDYLTTGELRNIYTDGPSITYGYDSLGRRTSMDRANGTAQGWSWDAAGRLSGMTDDVDGTANDRLVTFGYNPAGQIVGRTEANDIYAFTSLANQNVTDTHNGLNQVTATGSTSVSHDGRGNTDAIGSAGYSYDSENHLTSGPGATLSYDPLGRLYQVTTSTGSRRYLYDGLQAMTVQDVPNVGGATADYVVSGDTLNTPLLSYTSAGRVYHHADERGSIVAQSSDSGSVNAVNRYDEYGMPQGGSVTGRFGYTGQSWLPELGMYDYHARVYNPNTDHSGGRFMQTDPLGYEPGTNLYGYVSGDPANLVDPFGLTDRVGACRGCKRHADGTGTGGGAAGGTVVGTNIIVTGPRLVINGSGFGSTHSLVAVSWASIDRLAFSRDSSLSTEGNEDTGENCPSSTFYVFQEAADAALAANPTSLFGGYLSFLAPMIRGTRIHYEFAQGVRAAGGLYSAEVSYFSGVVVPYGFPGSVRADGVYGFIALPEYVVELKTGLGNLPTPSEVRAYHQNLPPGTKICALVEGF